MHQGQSDSSHHPGALTPRGLSTLAGRLYRDQRRTRRWIAKGRPWICPFDAVIERIEPGASVLDIGCGGGMLLGLAAAHGRVARGVGFDADAQAIAAANAMRKRLEPATADRLTFTHLDAQAPWPEGLFDVVCLIDVMHHLPAEARPKVIAQAAAKLRPGGRFIYKDMGIGPRWRRWANRLHDRVMAGQWIVEQPLDDVIDWARGAGLRCVERRRMNRLWYAHELCVFHGGPA